MEFDRAPFGIIGLETAVPLALDRLVHPGVITLRRLVQLLSVNPARILNVAGGTLRPDRPADITIFAPDGDDDGRRVAIAVEVAQLAVRRLDAARRRRGDHRRRARRCT